MKKLLNIQSFIALSFALALGGSAEAQTLHLNVTPEVRYDGTTYSGYKVYTPSLGLNAAYTTRTDGGVPVTFAGKAVLDTNVPTTVNHVALTTGLQVSADLGKAITYVYVERNFNTHSSKFKAGVLFGQPVAFYGN